MNCIIQDPFYNAQGGSTVCTTVLYHSGMIELMKQTFKHALEISVNLCKVITEILTLFS